MSALSEGWRIQTRVIGALMIRELNTRFGRDNIGFLWICAEPMLFAGLVGLVWSFIRGPEENGIGIVAFIGSGYIPLTFFRSAVGRSNKVVEANSGLMYHRQIKMLDFVFTRVFIEMIGAMMAYVFFAGALGLVGLFPIPANPGILIAGFLLYALFTLSVCLILAPLSELSEVIEKLLPVTTYIMIPFSGTFQLNSWLSPSVRAVELWSPPANAMEIMRLGLFGDKVHPYYDLSSTLAISAVLMMIGLIMSRRMRRDIVVA
ncbi:MAG: ABC transporter permease [Sphingomonadales bacterium]|nr:ABC transporter permease [Sphingomonadales bacterium]